MCSSAALARLSDATRGCAARSHAARSLVRSLLSDRDGVTAIEYALMAAFIAVVIVGAIQTLGQQALTQLFNKVASSL